MSTRGSYLLAASQEINHFECFYVHSDNDPEGAAHYFLQMHFFKNPPHHHGHYADRFFRANLKAEFRGSNLHDSNLASLASDVEYCYTLNAQGQLTVLHRSTSDCRHWMTIYKDPWYTFVNQQLPDKEKLYLFKTTEGKVVMTLTEAKDHIKGERTLAKKAFDNGVIMDAKLHANGAKLFQIQMDTLLQETKPEFI